MLSTNNNPIIGLYEKALPTNMSLVDKVKKAKELGFAFVEMSIDETDERLARLDWDMQTKITLFQCLREQNMRIPTLCLSAHRRFPLGSSNPKIREKGMDILKKAIDLADDIGIRVIQLAGYDVYYEEKSLQTRAYFIENLRLAMIWARKKQVTLSIEIMDDPFMNSISKFLEIQQEVADPDLKVYVDIGNLSAWPQNQVGEELRKGGKDIVAVHLKDTLSVSPIFPGKFKNVPFGTGDVDFSGCLQILHLQDYQGPFLMEMWTSEELEQDIEEIKKARHFIDEAFRNGGWKDA